MLLTLGVTSQQAFGAVGAASIEARERLVALAGGLDKYDADMRYFAEHFLTEAQKLAPTQKYVTDQLAELGMSGLTTADQFRDAVLNLATSGALATEMGAKQYAGLLAIAPAFSAVTDAQVRAAVALNERAQTERDAADAIAEAAAKVRQAEVDLLRSNASTAFTALQKSVDASKAAVQKSFNDLIDGINDSITAQTDKVARLQGLQSALNSARTVPTGVQAEYSRQAAQAQIMATLAIAKASGVLPDASTLADSLRAVSGDASNQFSSLADFQRDQLRTANNIEELSGLTDNQLTVEQRTLATLIDQKALAQAAYDGEMARLDGILVSAQAQLDATNGTLVALLDLKTALAAFTQSVGTAMGNSTVSGQSGLSQSAQIESMYQTMLGRHSDAGGLQFYLDALKTGTTMAQIAGYFAASPEYQGLYTAQQPKTTTTEGSAMLTELQTMNRRLANVESATQSTATSTDQFAGQFDNATGGGGPLLTSVVGTVVVSA